MNNMVNKGIVRDELKKVIDPELGINIVDLGLIYNIEVRNKKDVYILMTLTTPGCPLAGIFDQLVGDAVREIEGVSKVEIKLTFDPPWIQDMMSDEVKAQLGID